MNNRILTSLVLIVALLIPGELVAQQSENNSGIFDDFGTVSDTDLSLEPDHDFPYEYLMKNTSIHFREEDGSIEAVINHLVRIKIYTDDPLDIAEASLVGIPFYFADNMEQVENVEGFTHQPDGNRLSLDRSTETISEINSRYRFLEFEMPEPTQGSVLEYKYTVVRRYIEELPDFYFAHRVPTRNARMTLQNQNFLRYNTITQNIDFDVEYREEFIDNSGVPLVFSYSRPEPVKVQTWESDNVPPVNLSAYISSVDDIRGKLKFQISEFGVPRQPLENSWEYVAAQIRRNSNPDRIVEKQTDLLELGSKIKDFKQDPYATQDSIFKHVNRRATYNGLSAVFTGDELSHILEGEPANQAEINMVLLTMLRGAGISAKPMFISGREFGRINESFPSLYQFNRVLVYSMIDEEAFFMDASFSQSRPNLIPVESYSEKGFVLDEEGFKWVDIRPEESVFDMTILLEADLTEIGGLMGTITASTRGYPSQQIMKDLEAGDLKSEIIKSTFFEAYPDIVISNSEITSTEKKNSTLRIEADFELPEYATSFSDGFEYRPMIVGYLFDNPFESATRRVPITLDAPENLVIQYRVTLPGGYSVEADSQTRTIQLNGAELSERYLSRGNELQYSFEIDIAQKDFPASRYSQLRQMYQRWVELSNENWFITKE